MIVATNEDRLSSNAKTKAHMKSVMSVNVL